MVMLLALAGCTVTEVVEPPPNPLQALHECLATAARDVYRAGPWDQAQYDTRARACYQTYWP
jgi:hypothetical protein